MILIDIEPLHLTDRDHEFIETMAFVRQKCNEVYGPGYVFAFPLLPEMAQVRLSTHALKAGKDEE